MQKQNKKAHKKQGLVMVDTLQTIANIYNYNKKLGAKY